jgi:hypothetical protein
LVALFLRKSMDSPRSIIIDIADQEAAESHECRYCDHVFGSLKAVQQHERMVRHARAEERLYAVGTACPNCNVEFHSRMRVLRHLAKDQQPVLRHCEEETYQVPRVVFAGHRFLSFECEHSGN